MGMIVLHEYYFLTGDPGRPRGRSEHLGNTALTMLWKLNHDDRRTAPARWAGRPLVQTQDARRRPNAKFDRYIGWPLFCLPTPTG